MRYWQCLAALNDSGAPPIAGQIMREAPGWLGSAAGLPSPRGRHSHHVLKRKENNIQYKDKKKKEKKIYLVKSLGAPSQLDITK